MALIESHVGAATVAALFFMACPFFL